MPAIEFNPDGPTVTRLAVAIISFNTIDDLRDCLTSVRAAGATNVVVVDNGSTDGSVDMVRRDFPEVKVRVNGSNPGYGAASNDAIAATGAEYVLLLNTDTLLRQDALRQLETHLDANPRAAIVGPRLHNPDGTLQRSAHGFPSPLTLRPLIRHIPGWRERSLLTWSHEHDRVVSWVKGAALAIRTAAFNQVGGFDPAFFMYFEETDLCRRLGDKGWEIHFTPATTVIHKGGTSTVQRRAEMEMHFYGSMRQFYMRHYPRGRLRQLDLVLRGTALLSLLRDRARLALARDPDRSRRLREDAQIWTRVLLGRWPARRGHGSGITAETHATPDGTGSATP